MKTTKQLLDEGSRAALTSICGHTLQSMSGRGMESASTAWEELNLNSSAGTVKVTCVLELLDFTGDQETYPQLAAALVPMPANLGEFRGRTYYQEQGQVVEEIWILRTKVEGWHESAHQFTYITDDTIALKTNQGWTSITKSSHMSEVLYIGRADSLATVEKTIPQEEWVSDLIDTYECSQEWIQIA